MIAELLGLLSSVDVGNNGKISLGDKFGINLNKRRVRSISSLSSNSIFYYPMIISDQCTLEEIAMISRAVEKQYASFVVACISMIPFHRIKADDQGSVEEYLQQFHQNIGINSGNGIGAALNYSQKLSESSANDEVMDFYQRIWNESVANNTDYVKDVCTELSLLEMYNENPLDPRTQMLMDRQVKVQDEMDTWGFVGDDPESDDYDVDLEDDYDDDDLVNDGPMDESYMHAADRKALPDSAYGLPKKRKFPLHNPHHVTLAMQMFHHVTDEEERKTLAKNIVKKVKEFNMHPHISKDCALYSLVPADMQEKDKPAISESAMEFEMLDESVKEAVNKIKFQLEVVSDNKILSCSSLSKLRSLESKLKLLKNKYASYLKRYKKKYEENKESGNHAKLHIQFNKMFIDNPKVFMQQYGQFIKEVNKRLKLVEKRRNQINKLRGNTAKLSESAFGDFDMDVVDTLIEGYIADMAQPDSVIFLTEADRRTPEQIAADERLNSVRASLTRERTRETISQIRQSRSNTAKNRADIAKSQTDAELIRQQTEERVNSHVGTGTTRSRAAGNNLGTPNLHVSSVDPSKNDLNMVDYAKNGHNHDPISPFRDRSVFTDMDMKKSNEMIPTFTKASIGFIVDETEEVVTRDVMIGIKTYVHKVPTGELVSDIYNTLINKRKFLKFVKFVTGEERSLSDLLFGIKELKNDAIDGTKSGQWRSAFRRRRRWAKMAIPYLTKEYTPNGTIVITMNEVDYIRDTYGIDLMKNDHVKMLMDENYLLGFVILDQSNELVYVMYDGHNYQFQEYSYAMLEREQATSDRTLRELYRSFSR